MIVQEQELMGTVWRIKLPKEHEQFFSFCFSFLQDFEDEFSRFKVGGTLHGLNKHLNVWQTISPRMQELFTKAQEVFELTNGAFDITVKKDLDRLGYDEEYSFTEKKVSWVKKLFPSSKKKRFQLKENQVKLFQEVDFGGIGKGFALDQLAQALEKEGVKTFYLDAGGDILTRNSQKVPIGLEHPLDPTKIIAQIDGANKAIAGSSSNRRQWGKNNHLIDPKKGASQQEMLAVYVVAKEAWLADSLATSLCVSSEEQAIDLLERTKISAIIMTSSGKVMASKDLAKEIYV